MLSPVLLLLAQAASSPQAPPDAIIVVGRRAEQALADCLERGCPSAEEIEASLQASVEQFSDARYSDARRTLQKAIQRNRAYAGDMPGPVSSLYATLATVAEHEGDSKLWRSAASANVDVLRRHLGEAHIATLGQELAFADNLIGVGRAPSAERVYRDVQRKAVESGQPQVAAGAAFRRAWLALIRQRDDEAKRFADQTVELAGADNRLMAELRDILHTRIAVRRGDEGAVDALAARLRQSADKTPTLLFAPAMEDINPPEGGMGVDRLLDSKIRFADVGYWIRPDGRTADAEMLRDGGLGQWKPVILEQLAQRRYVPLDVEPGHPGLYRIDRFTVRGTKDIPLGSRIARRMGRLTVHIVDLTATDAMSEARRQRTEEGLDHPEG